MGERSSTKPPSHETRPPTKSAVTFLRWTAGRWNGRRVSSVVAGGALSLPRQKCGGKRTSTRFHGLRNVRHHILAPPAISRAKAHEAMGKGEERTMRSDETKTQLQHAIAWKTVNDDLKRRPVRREPIDQDWEAGELWALRLAVVNGLEQGLKQLRAMRRGLTTKENLNDLNSLKRNTEDLHNLYWLYNQLEKDDQDHLDKFYKERQSLHLTKETTVQEYLREYGARPIAMRYQLTEGFPPEEHLCPHLMCDLWGQSIWLTRIEGWPVARGGTYADQIELQLDLIWVSHTCLPELPVNDGRSVAIIEATHVGVSNWIAGQGGLMEATIKLLQDPGQIKKAEEHEKRRNKTAEEVGKAEGRGLKSKGVVVVSDKGRMKSTGGATEEGMVGVAMKRIREDLLNRMENDRKGRATNTEWDIRYLLAVSAGDMPGRSRLRGWDSESQRFEWS